ncbi:MAG: nucleotidyl transferase AbiEii/AbiGii toxin family protein [Chloroflexi bacterium]|nr:nucleotidyl transferase AbiEii/AbiGii toxin family protein [Chloroflexota bacterium]
MIEKRLVQWYASDAGVDLDIAEREIILAYVLRILSDGGMYNHLAFKGGTAIRKLILGKTGRFSLDLDFTAIGDIAPDAIVLELVGLLHDQTHYGITFTIPGADYYVTEDANGCGAEVTYGHDWMTAGRFGVQISFRAPPLLPVQLIPLHRERYFDWMDVDIPDVPALDLHEIIGEKVRAATQRSRVRDLYDLYQLAHHPYDRDLVRQIAVIKCWETRYLFDPAAFLDGLPDGKYNWSDLSRLVRSDRLVPPDEIVRGVQQAYAFLRELADWESRLAADPYGREQQVYRRLVTGLGKE